MHDFYSPVTFSSPLVNPQYTNFHISTGYNTLFIEPYLEMSFTHNDKEEKIKVFCSPRRNRLAHIVYPKDPLTKNRNYRGDPIIKFTKFKFNMGNRKLNDKCWNDCRAAIMKYITDHPKMKLDAKHLDPSLKKLMAFS